MSRKQYEKFLEAEEQNKRKTEIVNSNIQKNLNSRMDKCYIRFLTAEDFDAQSGQHYDEQISIVLRDSTLELWKGDVRIFLTGDTGDTSIQLLVQNL